ncbi:leucine--tRNA ligase [Candidatus Micrarchaeota archaeon]|nr:leucine--tRNA ligase [Candidatus Micrarchaeota archaeon]
MPIDFKSLDAKWQKIWKDSKSFEPPVDEARKKFLITFPYPYLNGPMHVGHSYSFFRADAYARFKRMQGFNVLFPQGFHATGEPIMGTVERLRNNDQTQIEIFKNAGATDLDLENFKKGPEYVANFWKLRWTHDLQTSGASIDWRRSFITTDLTPQYSRFIEWQYVTLKKKGYVVQGTHPVVWCPHDLSPTGDHDRYEGEGESPVEYTLIKFELQTQSGEKIIFPCATLRPETAYGATNIWLNPNGKYVAAKIGDENWIIGESAIPKLKDQLQTISAIIPIDPKAFIGKSCSLKILNQKIPILPANFVLDSHGSGVVMSVPAHAPYDYMALADLKKNPVELKQFGLSLADISSTVPIPLITCEGYGAIPAKEEIDRLQITSQKDKELLEKATSNLYKQEFHKGILNEKFQKFKGMKVSDSKLAIISEFYLQKIAQPFWETSADVICRCMTKCHVKILENQWFLKFSDRRWKDAALENLKSMNIYPQEARLQMENTIEWLQNKACARKGGLGTKLPWDKEWKVETLSDSTIYMAYYTISRLINEKKIPASQLTNEAFDFIFLATGSAVDISKTSGMDSPLLLELRREFEYFYPVDLRNSGKDLLQNHLLFFIFHHTAIFRKEHLPKGISVNGYVTVEGEKMSKSKGNFIPIYKLLSEYGADLVRINIIASGENLDDADWKYETLKTYIRAFEYLQEIQMRLAANGFSGKENSRNERLFESRLNLAILNATKHMENLEFRSSVHQIVFVAIEALRKYASASGKSANFAIIKDSLEKIIQMICPFSPHFAEELWQSLNGKGMCGFSAFPSANQAKIDQSLEEEEQYLENVKADVQKIISITGSTPKSIRLFTAEKWKSSLLKICLDYVAKNGKMDFSPIIKEALSLEEMKPNAKAIPSFLQSVNKTVNYYKNSGIPKFDETALLESNSSSLEKLFACKFEIINADLAAGFDPENKAVKSLPLKPAIFIEKQI